MEVNLMTMRLYMGFCSVTVLACVLILSGMPGWAGSLNPEHGPQEPGSQMYSLEAVFQRLHDGTPGEKSGTFPFPLALPEDGQGKTLDEVMAVAPALDNDAGAVAADVLFGKKFWGLTSGEWGTRTGAMPDVTQDVTPTKEPQNIPQGYHDGTGHVLGDEDLVAGNIVEGKTIFDVEGTFAGMALSPVSILNDESSSWGSGRFISYDRDDALDGVEYVDLVKDTVTGLIWTKSSLGPHSYSYSSSWCTNTDLTQYTPRVSTESLGFRLPTQFELLSLLNGHQSNMGEWLNENTVFEDIKVYEVSEGTFYHWTLYDVNIPSTYIRMALSGGLRHTSNSSDDHYFLCVSRP